MEKVNIVLLILYISSLNCFAEKTDISTKDESNLENKNSSTNTKDKRDKRQTYRDILTLYGGWKPILPGSPYHFGSQIFKKEDVRNVHFSPSEHSESLIFEPNLFYFDAPNYEQPKKNIYAYYPPPIISSNYNKHLQPKPLYKERYRNPMQNIQQFQISDLQTFTLKDPKQVEVLNLEVSVLPINDEGDKNYKGSHKIQEILATVPIAPEIIGDKPPPSHRQSSQQPSIPIKNSDIIIPTIPINSEHIQPIENIPQLPLFHSHVQNQPHHQKQEELAITVFSNINQGDKSLHVPKEEIKVVPVELGEDILQPAAIVDEVVELKEVPLHLDGANEKQYASSERYTSVSYKNSLGTVSNKQVIFPSSSNRNQASLSHLKFHDKKEQLVSLNLKPGETVKDALIQFAMDPKKSSAENHKVADEPFETVEIVEIPKTDYVFSRRSGKSLDKKEAKIKEKLKSSL